MLAARMTSGRIPAIALALLLCVTGSAAFWAEARSSAGMDFYQMWVGARMARETTDFYAPATRMRMGETYLREAVEQNTSRRQIAVASYRRNLESLSTPFLYAAYAPFGESYDRDLFVFQLSAFLALIGWVVLFARLFGHGVTGTLLLLAVLLLAFEPVRSDARVANMNHVILLMLAVAAWLTVQRRFAMAGAILAIATMTKPYVILAIPLTYIFWIAQRRWRHILRHGAGAVAGAAAAAIASSLYFRSWIIWPEWLRAFRSMPEAMVPLDIGNVAFAVIIRELTGIDASIVLLLIVVAIVAAIAFRRTSLPSTDAALIALGCVAFQLGSPLVWVHHLLLSVPLIGYLLRPGTDSFAARRQIAAGAAMALLAIEPWAAYVPSMIHVAALVNMGLVIAFVAALVDVTRPGEAL